MPLSLLRLFSPDSLRCQAGPFPACTQCLQDPNRADLFPAQCFLPLDFSRGDHGSVSPGAQVSPAARPWRSRDRWTGPAIPRPETGGGRFFWAGREVKRQPAACKTIAIAVGVRKQKDALWGSSSQHADQLTEPEWNFRPLRSVRIRTTKNPRPRDSRTCFVGGIRSSKAGVGLGRTPEFPDSLRIRLGSQ